MTFYLAFDPGKTTGWAMFDGNGQIIQYGQASLDELIDLTEEWARVWPISTIIYESFVLFRHKARQQTGSKMEASQAIGIIKTLARKTDATLVEQDPTIKSLAQKWTQLKPIGDHAHSHWVDAFNHGAYWLIRQGIRKTALEMEQERKNGSD
jgi:hypothetical protein